MNGTGNFGKDTGVLLVQRNDTNQWGTICSDYGFNTKTAAVICKWLGYEYLVYWTTAGKQYVR